MEMSECVLWLIATIKRYPFRWLSQDDVAHKSVSLDTIAVMQIFPQHNVLLIAVSRYSFDTWKLKRVPVPTLIFCLIHRMVRLLD